MSMLLSTEFVPLPFIYLNMLLLIYNKGPGGSVLRYIEPFHSLNGKRLLSHVHKGWVGALDNISNIYNQLFSERNFPEYIHAMRMPMNDNVIRSRQGGR